MVFHLLLGIAVLFHGLTTFATMSDSRGLIKMRWIGPAGDTRDPGWATQSKWSWEESKSLEEYGDILVPVFQTWVVVPKDYEVLTIDTEPSSSLEVFRHLETKDYPGAMPYPGEIVRIHFTNYADPGKAVFYMKHALSGKLYQSGIEFRIDFGKPLALVDPVCEEIGIGLEKIEGDANLYFASLSCDDQYDQVRAYLVTSYDVVWQNEYSQVTWKNLTPRLLIAEFHRPQVRPQVREVFGDFLMTNRAGDKKARYHGFFEAGDAASRFYAGLGVGLTYLNFSQGALLLHQLGLTGKGGFGFTLIPRVLTFDLGGYYTITPIFAVVTPNPLGGANFYGVNARIGYELPKGLGATRWKFLVGGYFTGMMTEGNRYGISQLYGPQVFVSTTTRVAGATNWSAYLKYAPLGQGQFDLGSFEIAGGASLQVGNSQYDPYLTLDVSYMSISAAIAILPVSLYTFSLGVQMSF